MNYIGAYKKIGILLLVLALLVPALVVPARAAEDEVVTEASTYVLDRDANGQSLYLYQSPCMLGYDLDEQYGGNGVPIQVFVYTMYDKVNNIHLPAYCTDIHVTAVQGTDYRRLNLEDSPFSSSAAGLIRAILQKGFYIIPVQGESDSDHAARVSQKTAELGRAAGVESLTTGEAIAATQAAIWRAAHGARLTFPKFCRYTFNPTNTKYGNLCSYNELRSKDLALINANIGKVYNYLLSLETVTATEKTVSAASFTKLSNPVVTPNGNGTYTVSVTATVDVDMAAGDSLTLTAALPGVGTETQTLHNGEQTVTLMFENVSKANSANEVTWSISGYQTAADYFFFDASGERGTSQSMVGYSNSRMPVYAEVPAKNSRALHIYKSTVMEQGDGYVRLPLRDITFDLYPVATMEEISSGAVVLPDATEYQYPDLADFTLTTDQYGKASLNLTHHGLPDGVYLAVERRHPGIVAPQEPFYLQIPATDNQGNTLYEVTITPKNEVKGRARIEKDVISIGNDEAAVDAYAPHTWIISASVPEDIAGGRSYVIRDTLDHRLDYVGNGILKLEDTEGDAAAVDLVVGTDYTLAVTDVDSLAEGKPSDTFEIALTAAGQSKIAAAVSNNSFANYMLRFYFEAQINANAQMGEKIPNQATLSYFNSGGIAFEVASDKPVVYTGGMNLQKVDAQSKNALGGAVFTLYRLATESEVAAGGEHLTNLDGVVEKVIPASFFDNAALQGEKVTSVTSGEDGRLAMYGLAHGKYYLVETKAPDGYNTIGKAMELTVDAASHTDARVITVENRSGVVLPSTGGSGTAAYTVSGTVLVCAAGILLLRRKRRVNGN